MALHNWGRCFNLVLWFFLPLFLTMYRLLGICLLFCLTIHLTMAQKKARTTTVLRIDSLSLQGTLLDKGWKWHSGDNPDWAKAQFNDSTWEPIDLTQTINAIPQLKRADIGWLRLVIEVDSSLTHKPIAVSIRQSVATEIFFDEKLLLQLGKVNPDPAYQKTRIVDNSQPPLSLFFNRPGKHILAIRYSLNRNDIYYFSRYPFVSLYLSNLEFLIRDNSLKSLLTAGLSFVAGVFFLLFLIYIIFYTFNPQQKTNIYLSLYALPITMMMISGLALEGGTLPQMNLIYLMGQPLIYLSGFFFLLSIYTLFNQKQRGIFYGISIIMILLLLGLNTPLLGNLTIPGFVLSIPTVLVALEVLRVCIVAYWQKRKGSLIVLTAQLITIIAYTLLNGTDASQLLFHKTYIEFLQSFWLQYVSYIIQFIATPVSIAYLLARELVDTGRSLARQVVQVESLSALTLAQEREMQQILANQNKMLEQQVETRTAELKVAQAQLLQKEKLISLGELTAGIAHEIQNPLNFVNNFSEVSIELIDELKEEAKAGRTEDVLAIADDLTQNLQRINNHGKRADSIVKGMLEHSRTSTGEVQPTDLNALANEYLKLAYQGFRRSGVTAKDSSTGTAPADRPERDLFNCQLITDFDGELGLLKVVPQDIGRVLLNLYSNAFYAVQEKQKTAATDYQPTVSVSTHRSGDGSGRRTVMIRVTDNGIGIAENIRQKIFQPFFTTKPAGQGTGLGLSLSYDIITKGHGGSLEVDTTEGDGTEFTVRLPLSGAY